MCQPTHPVAIVQDNTKVARLVAEGGIGNELLSCLQIYRVIILVVIANGKWVGCTAISEAGVDPRPGPFNFYGGSESVVRFESILCARFSHYINREVITVFIKIIDAIDVKISFSFIECLF